MEKAIFINTERTGYHPDQVERRTCTVEELIGMLEELSVEVGMDAKVFFRNDNGYTYGELRPYDGTLLVASYDEDSVYLDGSDEQW